MGRHISLKEPAYLFRSEFSQDYVYNFLTNLLPTIYLHLIFEILQFLMSSPQRFQFHMLGVG